MDYNPKKVGIGMFGKILRRLYRQNSYFCRGKKKECSSFT
jgi:hypothetical protein